MDREKGLIQKNPNIKKTAKDTYREKLSFTLSKFRTKIII